MNNRLFIIFFVILSMPIGVCAQMSYREKYAGVLRHYSETDADSLKYRAALFLIDNMEGHTSPHGIAINHFIQRIHTMEKSKGTRELRQAWSESRKEGKTHWVSDSSLVSSAYLVENIDEAFETWRKSLWNNQLSFQHFCRYVLPHRINDEFLGEPWRKKLREQYSGIIIGVTDIAKAFAMVKDSVYKVIELSNPYCEYNLDPLTCNEIGRAECGQRCILLAAVLRALGIPAVVDVTPMWADYSQKGHGWVSVVMGNGETYTVFEDDSIARLFNPIDASQFSPKYKVTQTDYPVKIKTQKTPAKVYRMCYEHINKVKDTDPYILATPFINDVSGEYGLTTNVTLNVDTESTVYLYCYMSAKDWSPIAKAEARNGKVTFRNVGKGSVCVAMNKIHERINVLTAPFLVGENGIIKFFKPNNTSSQSITIDRKYPLCSYTSDTWGAMKGGLFEGSMKSDFSEADTLAVITQMPYYMTTLNSASQKKNRFLRYHAPKNNRSSLAELQFYTTDSNGNDILLTGKHNSYGVDTTQVENVFDGNPSTVCRGQKVGYTITLDLGNGNEQPVSKIVFCPSSDLNFVEKGHLYELYYFDTEWKLIERTYSKGDKLTFTNVPSDAILLLKDKKGGREERIFEYSNGKQIWY